ncbi:hypothetical protein M5689_018137 [Euphorbia peplus]|nr:hypothetical protein M5689_018137 [Euphorbia peplus]
MNSSSKPQNDSVIDPNPSLMKVVRNFTGFDYVFCTFATAVLAGSGYSGGVGGWKGALVAALLGLSFKFSQSYQETRDRLRGISRPSPAKFCDFPPAGQLVIVVEESSCYCGAKGCRRLMR